MKFWYWFRSIAAAVTCRNVPSRQRELFRFGLNGQFGTNSRVAGPANKFFEIRMAIALQPRTD